MIEVLKLHLWKEWREQRATAGILATSIALFVAGAGVLLPRDPYRDPLVLSCVLMASLAFALIAVGGDLLAGEERRGTLRFLERTPAGLSAAFFAKLVLFAAIVPAAALLGWLVALLATLARSGSLPEALLDPATAKILGPIAALALWTYAASTWVARGALALPLAAMLLAVLGWPAWLAIDGDPWYRPIGNQFWIFLALCCAGALAAAWFSFARGLSLGRGSLSAAWRGLAIGALFLSPSWGWAAGRWHAARTVDPRASDFAISQCWIGADGRRAFVNAARVVPGSRFPTKHGPQQALVVELDSGAWRAMGGRGSVCFPSAMTDPRAPLILFDSSALAESMHVLRSWEELGEAWSRAREGPRPLALDTRTLAPVEPAVTGEHLPDLPEGLRVWYRSGLGLRVRGPGADVWQRHLFHDFSRERLFDGAELFPKRRPGAVPRVLVRPGQWIAREGNEEPWIALDPESGAREPIEALRGCELVHPILADGRVLAHRDGALYCFDLEAGSLEPLRFADGRERAIQSASNARGGSSTPLGRLGPIVLFLRIDRRHCFARLDSERLELTLASEHAAASGLASLVATPDRDSLIALEDQRRLVRLSFDGTLRAVLFPR